MPDISATFTNKYGESRKWVIFDLGRDKTSPPVIFNDDLDIDQSALLYRVPRGAGTSYERPDGT